MNNRPPRITLYTTRQCPHCCQAKAFLQRHHIPFSEQDVERNQRAFLEFRRQGGRSVPMIVIGQQRLNGFDAKRLAQLLTKAGFQLR